MEKHVKVDKPMPEVIKKALKEKMEWREKIQSGQIKLKAPEKSTIIG